MLMKQPHIKAKFTTECQNAKNLSNDKWLISAYKIVDKKTEKVVVDCRVWTTPRSQTLYSSIWVNLKETKAPRGFEYCHVSGQGIAGGYGYDKESACIGDAINSAGIVLLGSPYPNTQDVDFKKVVCVGGTGCHKEALCAITYACGYNSCVLVECH